MLHMVDCRQPCLLGLLRMLPPRPPYCFADRPAAALLLLWLCTCRRAQGQTQWASQSRRQTTLSGSC